MSSTFWQSRRRGERPLIFGRDRERARLRALLDEAIGGQSSLVLINGEAGIGKTTLVDDLLFTARDAGCAVLIGGCYDLTTTPPYGPWIEVLQGYRQGGDSPPLPSWFGNLEELERVGSQTRLFDEARAFFLAVAERQPLVIVLEDLHWSDTASLDFLRYFARQFSRARCLLIGTYRGDEVSDTHALFRMLPAIVRESPTVRLNLAPLDDEAVRALIMERSAQRPEDLEQLALHISSLAEGNPLYVIEMLQTLEDAGSLHIGSGPALVGAPGRVVVPPLIGRLIEERLERLTPDAASALETAAIIGQEFDYELWQAISDAEDELLVDALETSLRRRLIEATARNGRYRFTHALTREVLYARQIWPRRRHWHLRTAEALASQSQPNPGAVAHHFQEAGDERAIEWLIRAGDVATMAFAFFEAHKQYAHATRLMPFGEESARHGWLLARLAYVCVRTELQEGLQYAHQAAEMATKTGDRALSVWARWRRAWLHNNLGRNGLTDLVEVRGILRQLTASELATLSEHLRPVFGYDARQLDRVISATLAEWFADYGRYEEARRQADMLLDGVRDDTLRYEDSDGYMARAISATALGQPAEAHHAFARAQAICLHNEEYYALVMVARQELRDLTLVYYTDQLPERRRLAEQILTAHQLGVSRGTLAELPPEWGIIPELYLQGEWRKVRSVADQAMSEGGIWSRLVEPTRGQLARHQGDAALAAWIVNRMLPNGAESSPDNQYYDSTLPAIRLAVALACDQHDLERARAWLATYDRWIAWSKRVQGKAEAHLLRARIARLDSDHERARDEAGAALERASQPRQPLAQLAAYRMLGQLAEDEERCEDARRYLAAALDLAERCAAPFEQALTLLVMAERAARRGEVDDAHELTARVRSLCEPLGAKPALKRVGEIEALLPGARRGADEHHFGLTDREVAVLRLVARGKTDAEAAEELFISPRTVSQHLRNIYNKLGVSNRAEATRVAVELRII